MALARRCAHVALDFLWACFCGVALFLASGVCAGLLVAALVNYGPDGPRCRDGRYQCPTLTCRATPQECPEPEPEPEAWTLAVAARWAELQAVLCRHCWRTILADPSRNPLLNNNTNVMWCFPLFRVA
jgi:hypothetical protein